MKIEILQFNPVIGNIEKNFNEALNAIGSRNADLLVFPQNFLLGYPSSEIKKSYPHLEKIEKEYLEKLANKVSDFYVLIGFNDKIALLNDGKIKNIENGEIINIFDKKIGILAKFKEFEFKNKVDIVIMVASMSSKTGTLFYNNKLLSNYAKEIKCPLVYVNQAGAQDSIVFDGGSRYYDENGAIKGCAKFFETDKFIFDPLKESSIDENYFEFDKNKQDFSLDYSWDLKRTFMATTLAIRDYFNKNGFKNAVLGLSGGLDSTVCAALLVSALGKEHVLGISMPSEISSEGSKNDALILAKNLGINFLQIPIKTIVDTFKNDFNTYFKDINFKKYDKSFTLDNLQARARAMILWGISNEFESFLPISTCDKSEDYMGYATINGDMSGGFAPIGDITKTKLKALATWINRNGEIIPQVIINKKPTAELEVVNGGFLYAEEALMPYEFMDEVIWRFENFNEHIEDMMPETFLYEKNHNIDRAQKKQWLEKFFKRLQNARYKQTIAPPVPAIDKKSLAFDYSCPICAKFL